MYHSLPVKSQFLKNSPKNIYEKNGTIFDHCAPPLDHVDG